MRRCILVVLACLLWSAPLLAQQNEPSGLSVPSRGYFIRLFTGPYSIGSTMGLGFGGGVAARPFSNIASEVAGTFDLARISGVNVYQGAVNYFYNFDLSGKTFTPAAGAGLVFARAVQGDASDAALALQLLGAVDMPVRDKRVVRGEMRLQLFSGDTAVVVLGGLSF